MTISNNFCDCHIAVVEGQDIGLSAFVASAEVVNDDLKIVSVIPKVANTDSFVHLKNGLCVYRDMQKTVTIELLLSKFKCIKDSGATTTTSKQIDFKVHNYRKDIVYTDAISRVLYYTKNNYAWYAIYGIYDVKLPKVILCVPTKDHGFDINFVTKYCNFLTFCVALDSASNNYSYYYCGYYLKDKGRIKTNLFIYIANALKSSDILKDSDIFYGTQFYKTIQLLSKFWTSDITKVKDITIDKYNIRLTTQKIYIDLVQFKLVIPKRKLKTVLELIGKQLADGRDLTGSEVNSAIYEFIKVLSTVEDSTVKSGCTVNGIPMSTHIADKFRYINKQRINTDELVACIGHIPRMLGDAKKYQSFLKKVGGLSLLHQKYIEYGFTVSTGIPLSACAAVDCNNKVKEQLTMFDMDSLANCQSGFNFLNTTNDSGTLKLQIEYTKTCKKPAKIKFMDTWYELNCHIYYFLNNIVNNSGRLYVDTDYALDDYLRNYINSNEKFADLQLKNLSRSISSISTNLIKLNSCVTNKFLPYIGHTMNTEQVEAAGFKLLEIVRAIIASNVVDNIEIKDTVLSSITDLTTMVERSSNITYLINKLNNKIKGFRVVGASNTIYYVNLAGGVFAKEDLTGYICIDPYKGHGISTLPGFSYTINILTILSVDVKIQEDIHNVDVAITRLCDKEENTDSQETNE